MTLDEHLQEPERHPESKTRKGFIVDLYHFVRSHSSLLIKALVPYVFFPLALVVISAHYILQQSPAVEHLVFLKNGLSKPLYFFVVINSLLYLATMAMLCWLIIKLVLLRQQHPTESGRILFSVFKKQFTQGLKSFILNFLILYVLYQIVTYLNSFLQRALWFSDDGNLSVYPLNNEINLLFSYLIPALVYTPLFYVGLSSLYLSVRDETGISEASVKVYKQTMGHYPRIWLQSLFLLILVYYTDKIMAELLYGLARFISSNLSLNFLFAVLIKKTFSFCLLALLMLSAIRMFHVSESHSVTPETT